MTAWCWIIVGCSKKGLSQTSRQFYGPETWVSPYLWRWAGRGAAERKLPKKCQRVAVEWPWLKQEVHDFLTFEDSHLGLFPGAQAHSTRACHKRHGSFTDLRPGIGTWASPYLVSPVSRLGRSGNHPKSAKNSPWNGPVGVGKIFEKD